MKETKKTVKKASKVEVKEDNNRVILIIKYVLPIVIAVLIFVGFKIAMNNYKMKAIDLAKYVSLVEGDKQSMVFVTSNDCDTCVRTTRLLKKMLQGSNIKTYTINIDDLDDNGKNDFINTLAETRENGVTAPALLIVKDNNLVSSFYGPFDEDLIITYLQQNGLVKTVNTNENSEEASNE